MKSSLSIYARTLLTISIAILTIFIVLALIYGTVYRISSNEQFREELRRNAIALSELSARRMDDQRLTFTSSDITGYLSFATRSTGAFVWVVNSNGAIIYHTGMPSETMALLPREEGGAGDYQLPKETRNTVRALYCQPANKTVFEPYLPNASSWYVSSAPIDTYGDSYSGEVLLMKSHRPVSIVGFLRDNNVPLSFSIAYILSLLIILWLSRNITHPISLLAKTANEVYHGNLSARVEIGRDKRAPMLERLEETDRQEGASQAHVKEDDLTRLVRTFNTLIAQFEERERLHSEFLSNVSHDLRTPATSIAGFVEGMRDGTIPPEKYEHSLNIIKDEVNRLQKLLNALFEQAHAMDEKALRMDAFDLHDWISSVAGSFEPIVREKNIHLIIDWDDTSGTRVRVLGDEEQLTRVLNNCLANAIRFAPRGGIVMIRTVIHSRVAEVLVIDNGPGFQRKDLDYVFDRFYKADKSRQSEGSGLGLYIARSIIRRHGETIEASNSDELGGAKIRFTLSRP
ncbi:MAG: HAMP domain-containing histidine kinase [Clostridiaceae bacterium]|nr:HAMP domain-containing histidine kinase [Clostridiaceae bacterium]